MNQTERQQWQARIEFYGKKWEDYKAKFPNRYPSRSTVQRWVREFKELNDV